MIDFEARVQQLYEGILRPGDTCIDVGAHEGRHLFPMASRVAPGGRVYAFEPIPWMVGPLRDAIAQRVRGATVELFEIAASDSEGESEFVVALDTPGYSGLKERIYDAPTRLQRIRVKTRQLDDVLPNLDSLRYVKIDVEGGEWGVIRGATRLIERFRPVVSFEFGLNSYAKYGVDPAEVHRFFDSRRYLVADILGRRLDEPTFVNSSKLQQVWDYAAFPVEMAAEMRFLAAG